MIKEKREARTEFFLAMDKQMAQSGLKGDWLAATADEGARGVVHEANGELFTQLARIAGFRDEGAVPQLLTGSSS